MGGGGAEGRGTIATYPGTATPGRFYKLPGCIV